MLVPVVVPARLSLCLLYVGAFRRTENRAAYGDCCCCLFVGRLFPCVPGSIAVQLRLWGGNVSSTGGDHGWEFRQHAEAKGDEIRVSVDDGSNCQSGRHAITTAEELGFDNRAAWDAATEDEKMKAVQDYFYGDGYPEWSWDDNT